MTATADIAPPQEIAEQPRGLLAWAKSLTITTAEEYATTGARLQLIKACAKKIADHYRPLKQSADEHKRKLLAAEREHLDPLQQAEALTKKAISTYQQAQEEARRAEERRLQAEAEAKAERERQALLKKAATAKKPETQQRHQEAAAAVTTPVVSVAPQVPNVPGLSIRKRWTYRIVDAAKIPREFLAVDEAKLAKFATAMKEEAKVEGVEFFSVNDVAASAR